MLHTYLTKGLTEGWGLRYPIVAAPMAGPGDGAFARAVTAAGGLGMIGVSSESTVAFVEQQAAAARGGDDARFGIGLMVWAIKRRPKLLDAAIAARPFAIGLSFGSPAPYVERVHAAGIRIATQVSSVAAAREAKAAGVDVIVAQGTEAGGHTGAVATLPLLQAVLDAVSVPVLAAGGIASPRGVAAVLAAGADGVWAGTAFLASPECANTPEARRRVIAATEADTVYTHTFDYAQRVPWPDEYPGRALRNRFAEHWHPRGTELVGDVEAQDEHARAKTAGNYDLAVIYAGQAVGLLHAERPVAEVVHDLGEGAERLLRDRLAALTP